MSHCNNNTSTLTDIFSLLNEYEYGECHLKRDESTGLQAIIAIHNTKLGPALGGCRFLPYAHSELALRDAMRLAQAMSYKAALASLPLGGGKSVIMRPETLNNREALFASFGKFVNELGGRYITALDSGTSEADMNIIHEYTPYIAGHSLPGGISGNPAPYTALGVRIGIQAAVKFALGRDSLAGLTILIQGVGQVGYGLARECHVLGAKLIVTDTNENVVQRCVNEFNAKVITGEQVFTTPCDVFAPCALGGIVNEQTIDLIKAPIIAGGANNVLQHLSLGEKLFQQKILYAPDYVINAGGLIHAHSIYSGINESAIRDKITGIYDRLLQVFERARAEERPTSLIADMMAKELIYKNPTTTKTQFMNVNDC